jgi:alanyl-tRNA synthetase
MEKQKADARKAWAGSGEAQTDAVWFDVREQTGATDFLGYDTETAEGEIGCLVRDGKVVNTLKKGQEGQIVLNQTPFLRRVRWSGRRRRPHPWTARCGVPGLRHLEEGR